MNKNFKIGDTLICISEMSLCPGMETRIGSKLKIIGFEKEKNPTNINLDWFTLEFSNDIQLVKVREDLEPYYNIYIEKEIKISRIQKIEIE